MEQIGLEAVLKDENFQAGLKRYTKGVSEMTQATEKGVGTMSRLGNVLDTAIGTALGVLTANIIPKFIGAVQDAINTTFKWGEELDYLGDQFGTNAEESGMWALALKRYGVGVQEGAQQLNYFTKQLATMSEKMEDAKGKPTPFAEALKKLGVTINDENGQLRDFNSLMPDIMDAFSRLPAGVEASNTAMELFGVRGGSKFLDFLRAGSGALNDATEKLSIYGLTMTDETVNQIEILQRKHKDLQAAMQGVFVQLGIELLPTMESFTQFLLEEGVPAVGTFLNKMKEIQSISGEWNALFREMRGETDEVLGRINEDAGVQLPALVDIVGWAMDSIKTRTQAGVGLVAGAWRAGLAFIRGDYMALNTFLGEAIYEFFRGWLAAIGINLPRIEGGFQTIFTAILLDMADFAGSMISGFTNAINGALAVIQGMVGQFYGLGSQMIQGLVDGVTSGASGLIQAIVDTVTAAITAAKNLLGIHSPSAVFAEMGAQMMSGLIQGFTGSTSVSNTYQHQTVNNFNLSVSSVAPVSRVMADFAIMRSLASNF